MSEFLSCYCLSKLCSVSLLDWCMLWLFLSVSLLLWLRYWKCEVMVCMLCLLLCILMKIWGVCCIMVVWMCWCKSVVCWCKLLCRCGGVLDFMIWLLGKNRWFFYCISIWFMDKVFIMVFFWGVWVELVFGLLILSVFVCFGWGCLGLFVYLLVVWYGLW